MSKKNWALASFLVVFSILPVMSWADFTMTDPNVIGTGSGVATATSIITNDQDPTVTDQNFLGLQDITLDDSTAEVYQESVAVAFNGTASTSASLESATNTQTVGDDTVTATVSGTTSVTAQADIIAINVSDANGNQPLNGNGVIFEEILGAERYRPGADNNLIFNYAVSRLIAAGGQGTVEGNPFFNTETGFMLATADAEAVSRGSLEETDETPDAQASASGNAGVQYRFAGSPGPETVTVTDASVTAEADEDYPGIVPPSSNTALAVASVQSLVGWTDSPTEGQQFGSGVGINSDATVGNVRSTLPLLLIEFATDEFDLESPDDGVFLEETALPEANAAAAGNAEVNFTYRPISPVFSFVGNATGSTGADVEITQGSGILTASGGKNAVGRSGTQLDASPLALSWLAGSVDAVANSSSDYDVVFDFIEPEQNEEFGFLLFPLFAFNTRGYANNPAVLGDEEFDPDPSMTATTQYGTYSASMGSSSLVNSSVEAQATVEAATIEDGLDSHLIEYDDGGPGPNLIEVRHARLSATAFGFAIATRDFDLSADVGNQEFFNLADDSAFIGMGGITGLDEPTSNSEGGSQANVSANASNLFGVAVSPDHFGTLDNGNSSVAIGPNEDGVYERSPVNASVDLVTGDNYPVAISHNQADGALPFDASNAPWWQPFVFGNTLVTNLTELSEAVLGDGDNVEIIGLDAYDHVAGAFIGGGGN